MAKGYSLQALGVFDGTVPVLMGDGAITGSRARRSSMFITGASLVSQAVGAVNDTIVLGSFPRGALFNSISFQSDTVFTGCTLQFGTASNPTKYGSIAAPAANTLYTLRPVAVRMAGQYAAEEIIVVTVTGAAVPAAFNAEMELSFQSVN
ncbi:hypothetical protein [Novosphingobium rosa]|uniref:hypothetical protein n=1 Tax=Novosphingobium rosa TaxID=76978 RepID=UPI00082A4AE2|nr:hypothetical protein [Novosphingobium rosa]